MKNPFLSNPFGDEREDAENPLEADQLSEVEMQLPNDPPDQKQIDDEEPPSPEDWLDIEGRKNKIPRNLRRAIFDFESGKRQTNKDGSTLTSPKNAKGYTQILKPTGKAMGFQNVDNIYDNISGGTKYLREGYDEAKRKGLDDEGAWKMAIRGYLNGHGRQEQNLWDGNVDTNQYEANVLSKWSQVIQSGEREDDWNDESFLTEYERKQQGLQSKVESQQAAPTLPVSQNSDDVKVLEETEEDQRINARIAELDEDEKVKAQKSLGAEGYKRYGAYLMATGQSENFESLEKFIAGENKIKSNDPTVFPMKNPVIRKVNGKSVSEIMDLETPIINAANSQEVAARAYGAASTVADNDFSNPDFRRGLREFYKERGITDPNSVPKEERDALFAAYNQNLSAIRSVSPDGDIKKINNAAIDALKQIVRNEGAAGLDKPENTWIRQFAFKNNALGDILRADSVDVYEALYHNSRYKAYLTDVENQTAQNKAMQEMVKSGIINEDIMYPDGTSKKAAYRTELNISQIFDEAGGDPALAGRKAFQKAAKVLGFDERETEMALAFDPNNAVLRNLQTGKNLQTPEDSAGYDGSSPTVVANYTILPDAVKSLMESRRAINAGYDSVTDYQKSIVEGTRIPNVLDFLGDDYKLTTGRIREAGAALVDKGNQIAKKSMEAADKNEDSILGNIESGVDTAIAGLARGTTLGLNEYTKLASNLGDVVSMIASAPTLSEVGSRENKLRNQTLDQVANRAREVMKPTSERIDLDRFAKDGKASFTQKAIYGLTEGTSNLVTQLPLYSLYGAGGGAGVAAALPINAVKQLYEGDLKSLAFATALDLAMFGGGAAIKSGILSSAKGELVSKAAADFLSRRESVQYIGNLASRAASKLGQDEGRLSAAMERYLTKPRFTQENFSNYLAIGSEQLYQIPLPALQAVIDTNLSKEGRELKDKYRAIKEGRTIRYPIDPSTGREMQMSDEEKAAYRQQIIDEYENMTASLTAEGIFRDVVMGVAMPFLHSDNAIKDAQILAENKGAKLGKEGIFATFIPEENRNEYSGYVQLPSGRTEYMVIPENHPFVKDALENNRYQKVEKDLVDKQLLISRINSRVSGKAEYQALAEKVNESSLQSFEVMNPIMTEDAIRQINEATAKGIQNADQLAKDYISSKQAESQAIQTNIDATLKSFVEQEQAKADQEVSEAAVRKEWIDDINTRLKDKNTSSAEKATLLQDRRYLMAEEVNAQKPKNSKQASINEEMIGVAQKVNEDTKVGKDYAKPEELFRELPEATLRDMADQLQNTDGADKPYMQEAYKALADETNAQYKSLVDQGFKFEKFEGEGEPYPKGSADMLKDLRENKHLYFFATDSGFGKEGETYNHPLMADSGLKDANGSPMLANDVFRAVHDALGHGVSGVQFGARGEHNATIAHSKNFSDKALPALLSETSFQNAWVNYGEHLRKGGRVPKKGEEGFVPVTQRPFADQKIVDVTPEWVERWKRETGQVGSEKQTVSNKQYESIGKRIQTEEINLTKEKLSADDKRAIARLIADKKAAISQDGRLLSAEADAKERYKATTRARELSDIELQAKYLSQDSEKANAALQSLQKDVEATRVATTPEKAATEPENVKQTVSETAAKPDSDTLAGKAVKYKGSNKLAEVAKENKNSVVLTDGTVVSKDLLDIPAKIPAKEVPSYEVSKVTSDVLKGDEFAMDYPESIGKTLDSKKNAVVVNENLMKNLDTALGVKSASTAQGFAIHKSDAASLIRSFKDAGLEREADIVQQALKNSDQDSLVMFNGSKPLNLERTSVHEIIHENTMNVVKTFPKRVIDAVEKSAGFKNLIAQMDDNNFYKKLLTTKNGKSDMIHEIFAHGLTGDAAGLRVTPDVLADALSDVVKALSQEYSDQTVAKIVNNVLKEVDTIKEAGFGDKAKFETETNTVKTEASDAGIDTTKGETERIGLRSNESQKLQQSETSRAETARIQQAIERANEPESFVTLEGIQDRGRKQSQESGSENRQVGLKKVDTETDNFKKWFKDSVTVDETGKPQVYFHGTTDSFDAFNRDKINQFNAGFHLGTEKQANDFVSGTKGSIMPVFIRTKKPLVMTDMGDWGSDRFISQIQSKYSETLGSTPEFQEMKTGINKLYDKVGNWDKFIKSMTAERLEEIEDNGTFNLEYSRWLKDQGMFVSDLDPNFVRAKNDLMIEFMRSQGYDSIKYVNKYEGFNRSKVKDIALRNLSPERRSKVDSDTLGDLAWEAFENDKVSLPDDEFNKLYGTEYSYLVFDPENIKSAVGNNGEFSLDNPNVLFNRDVFEPKQDEPETYKLTAMRLTRDGNPFSLTGKNGREQAQRVQAKVDPVFNFFVKGDNGYEFEQEFGANGKPFSSLKPFEMEGEFKLYDVYKDYSPEGRGLWRNYGIAHIFKTLKEEGYDGFFNSSKDVADTFRNRISLFDTPKNRSRITESKVPETVDDAVTQAIDMRFSRLPDEIKNRMIEENPETSVAEIMNDAVKSLKGFDIDSIDFDSPLDSSVSNDYVNGLSMKKVSTKNGISVRQVRKTLYKYGIPIKDQIFDTSKTLTEPQLKKAIELYQSTDLRERKSIAQLSNLFEIDKEAIAKQFRDNGVDIESAQISAMKTSRIGYKKQGIRSKYKTEDGEYIGLDSSYELAYIAKTEVDDNVKEVYRFKEAIPYEFNGKKYNYYPDFAVTNADGSKDLIEVKPQWKVNDAQNLAKFEAGRLWAEKNGYNFRIMDENQIGIDAFDLIDLNRLDADKAELRRIKASFNTAKRNIRNFRETVPATETEKAAHSNRVNEDIKTVLGLRKVSEEENPVEVKYRDEWLTRFNNKKIKDKSEGVEGLILPEGQVKMSDLKDRLKNNEDFEILSLNTLKEKYPDVDTNFPKAIDEDAKLIEVAMKGIAGKDWYIKSNEILRGFTENSLGKFLPSTFVRLIGATGQGMSPRENFVMASKYLNRMLAGSYPEKSADNISTMKASGLYNGDGRYNLPAKNIADAMNDTDLSTRKLGDFTKALLGDGERVVVDEWMNRLFTGKSGAPTPAVYDYIEGRVRYIARQMGLEPAQVQAALWVGYKQVVSEFVGDQVKKATDPKDANKVSQPFQRMLEGGDFKDVAESLGTGNTIPEFPTAAVMAKYREQLLNVVEPAALPKIAKGKPDDNSLVTGMVGYYYDLNRPTTDQARVLVDSVRLNQFLDQNPEMVRDLAGTYNQVYVESGRAFTLNKDLGKAGEAIFKAAYLKERGIDITDVDFNKDVMVIQKDKPQLLYRIGEDDENFKGWFRNSKTVDENGNPIVMFHGTTAPVDFEAFDTRISPSQLGTHVGTLEQAEWFTKYMFDNTPVERGRILPLYVKAENPMRLTDIGNWTPYRVLNEMFDNGTLTNKDVKDLLDLYLPDGHADDLFPKGEDNSHVFDQFEDVVQIEDLQRIIKEKGFDSVVYYNEVEGKGDSYIVLDPTQIKSALSNNGRFDENNPNMLYSRDNEENKTYFSNLERIVKEKLPNKFKPEQALNTLRNAGVKAEELDWMDVSGFLEGKESVTKAELQEYLKDNQIEIEEVTRYDVFPKEVVEANEAEYLRLRAERKKLLDERDRNTTDLDLDDRLSEQINVLNGKISDNEVALKPVKYKQYKQEGGENYRELLINLPKGGKNGGYLSTHWTDNENNLMHIRFDDRVDENGDRSLHIAEIQSDWHQEGRKQGYKSDNDAQRNKLLDEYNALDKEARTEAENSPRQQTDRYRQIRERQSQIQSILFDTNNSKAVSDAPFKNTWHELAFRRMLKYAVDNGYDSLTWDSGETVGSRFSQKVEASQVEIHSVDANTVRFAFIGTREQMLVDRKTGIIKGSAGKKQYEGKMITSIVSNDLFNKARTVDKTSLFSGQNISFGDEGMKTFYDRILPLYASKFVKRFGASIESTKISTNEYKFTDPKVEDFHGQPVVTALNKETGQRVNRKLFPKGAIDKAEEYVKFSLESEKNFRGSEVFKIPVTSLMESEIKNQPTQLFKRKPEDQRIQDLKGFDENEWLDLATDVAKNKVITKEESDEIRKLVAAKDLDGLQKYVANLNTMGLLEFLSSVRRAGLLTGLKTSARNMVSNGGFQALEEIARIPASVIDIAISTLGKRSRTVQGMSPLALTHSLVKTVSEGLPKALSTLKNGDNYFSTDDIRISREKTTGYRALKPIELYTKGVFRFLSSQDAIFRTFAEERAKYEIAALKSKESGIPVKQELANLDVVDLDRAAVAGAIAVFQNENKLNTAYQKFRGNRSEAVKFLLDMKIPFAKTPSNIFDRILDYTGIWSVIKAADSDFGKQIGRAVSDKDVAGFKKTLVDAMDNPETRAAFSFALSRGMVGWAVMTLGYSLAQKGMLYGFQDDTDETLRKVQEIEKSGYGSIKLGNHWADISSISPMSMLLMAGATYQRQKAREASALEQDKQSASQKAVSLTKIMMQISQQSPFIKAGAETFSERFGNPVNPFAPENLLPVDSFIPSIVSEVAATKDKYKRTIVGETTQDKILNKAKFRIPALRETLPAKVDILGKPVEQPFGFDPFATRKDQSNSFSNEAKRLGYNIPVPKRQEKEEFGAYNQRKAESGSIVEEILSEITNDPKYKEAKDATKRDMLKITNSVKQKTELTRDQRLYNVQVMLTREKLRKQAEELTKGFDMTDDQRKRFLTSIFSSALVTKTRKTDEAKENLALIKSDLKAIIAEKYEDWKDRKDSKEEDQEEK